MVVPHGRARIVQPADRRAHDDAVDREDVLCQVEFEDLVRRVAALRPQFDVELMMGAPETA